MIRYIGIAVFCVLMIIIVFPFIKAGVSRGNKWLDKRTEELTSQETVTDERTTEDTERTTD